jgi:HK97 family phage major capsid protein
MTPKELIEKRQQVNKLVMDVRKVMEKADTEKRSMTQEERNSISTMEADIDNMDADLNIAERQQERERKLTEPNAKPEGSEGRDAKPRESVEYRSAFARYVQDGERAVYTDSERRAMQADNALTGGTFMAPTTYISELIKDIDNATVIRGLARVFPLGAGVTSMGAPSLDNDVDDADWTAEIQVVGETSDMKFGERELTPHQISKLVKISNKLIAGATSPIETLVRERLAYKFGITQEKAFMTGDGSKKPLGLFTPSNLGIATAFDIAGSNTATAIKADTLMDALYDLKEGYQKNATWLFHRTVVKEIRKLKDNNNQYLWQPGLSGGNPSTILDRPYTTSEYAPNTLTSGLYVGMIGDFKYYWIADAMGLTIQVLKELFALTKQTGYIGLLETDGMPVLGNAFRRIKMG